MENAILIGIIIFYLFIFLQRNGNFIDFKGIFTEHLKVVLGNKLQFIGIFLVPVYLSVNIAVHKTIESTIVENLNIVLSIFLSMLFAFLSVLTAFGTINNPLYKKVLNETFNSVLFEIFIGFSLLMMNFLVLFLGIENDSKITFFSSVMVYYLFLVMLLNVFVVLKRIKILFERSNFLNKQD